jgi:hypothetical protein
MRKGFDGLSVLAQEVLREDSFSGHLFVLRDKRSDLINVLYRDGQGHKDTGLLKADRSGKIRLRGANVRNIIRKPKEDFREAADGDMKH